MLPTTEPLIDVSRLDRLRPTKHIRIWLFLAEGPDSIRIGDLSLMRSNYVLPIPAAESDADDFNVIASSLIEDAIARIVRYWETANSGQGQSF